MGKKILVVSALLGAILAFQNCGQSGFSDNSSSSVQGSSSNAQISGTPFALDVAPNLISYMSCSAVGKSLNTDAYYSFKVLGAETGYYKGIVNNSLITSKSASRILPNTWVDGGVHFAPDYLAFADKTYGSGIPQVAQPDKLQGLLLNNPVYRNARLQVAFRDRANVTGGMTLLENQQAFTRWASEPLVTPLSAPLFSSARDRFLSSFPKNSAGPSLVKGAISYLKGNNQATRDDLTTGVGQFVLSLEFAHDNQTDKGNFSGVLLSGSGIAGRGFSFQFGDPNPHISGLTVKVNTDKTRKPFQAINNIDEYLMSTSPLVLEAPAPGWNCQHYAIIRLADSALCPIEPAASVAKDKLAIVRKFLRVEDWNVNTTLGCIVPTSTNQAEACYSTGPNDAAEKAVWATTKYGTDYAGNYTTGVEYRYWGTHDCADPISQTYRECVAFASFCFKTP